MCEQRAAQIELTAHCDSQLALDLLRGNLGQDLLLGEILRAHDDPLARAARGEQQAGRQTGDSLRSTHPSPPSAASAMHAAGIAPARICAVSTEANPRKMKTPRPPPPIAAAMVAVPIVVTVATRTPARMTGAARGISTCHNNWRAVIPIAIADSRTARSTPRIPASVLRKIGSSA